MRVVVADATPLHYLILIDAVQILQRLFEKVHVPIEIREELPSGAAPLPVRSWMQQPPEWLTIRPAHAKDPTLAENRALAGLDLGERSAIWLAESIGADLLLIDERAGANLARQRGLAVTGTLGVLDLASVTGLIDLRDAFARLQTTNFRYPPSLLETLIEEEIKRKKRDA